MPTPRQVKMLAVLRDMGTFPRHERPRSASWEKCAIKTYHKGFVYILDHSPDCLELPDRNVKKQQHDERCMQMADFFDTRTQYEVNYVAAPRGTTPADWNNYWDAELATKTEEDLILIYYHGKAHGTNLGYKWHFQKGLVVNAHDFISRINGGNTDCTFFLDCFFHTRMSFGLKWKLENAAMMDFIFSPYQLHTGGGAAIDHEGDWSKAFVRNMIAFMEGEVQVPSWIAPVKSIPKIMSKDHTIYHNQGSGFKLARHEKDFRPVRRLVTDPVMVWSTGEYQFFGLEIRGLPDEIVEADEEDELEIESEPENEPEPEDEGINEDFDAAAQFADDQLNREADIADGSGNDGDDGGGVNEGGDGGESEGGEGGEGGDED